MRPVASQSYWAPLREGLQTWLLSHAPKQLETFILAATWVCLKINIVQKNNRSLFSVLQATIAKLPNSQGLASVFYP